MKKIIEIVPYNPNWPHVFEQEAECIRQALGDNCLSIHHIGSTSVPGLAAKPKIDMIAVVHDTLLIRDQLEKKKFSIVVNTTSHCIMVLVNEGISILSSSHLCHS